METEPSLPGTDGASTQPAAVHGDFEYTTRDGMVTITEYTGPGGAVRIPETIDGWPVTGIGKVAFGMCVEVTSITIPNGVTSIGMGAFCMCTDLSSVTIGRSVSNIGKGAFSGCSSLTSVTIPSSVIAIGFCAFVCCSKLSTVTIAAGVTSIGSNAFRECYGLTAIEVDALNTAYSSVDGVLFNKAQTTLIHYPQGKAGSYMIPKGVASIADKAFEDCSLTGVTIPNSVTSIGEYAFRGSAGLLAVCFKGNVPGLGSGVFDLDDKLIVYYVPGTAGWGPTFGGRPTAAETGEAEGN